MYSHKSDYFEKVIFMLFSVLCGNNNNFKSNFLPPSLALVFFLVFICENILPQQYRGYL